MIALARELVFALRSATVAGAAVLLIVLSSVAIGLGMQAMTQQRAAIDRMLELQAADEAAIQGFAESAGDAAYYTFYPVWDEASPLAFAAIGQRDVAPAMLRIRLLALEGQLYENETFNPELSLAGRFDFAFVLVYLAPLVLIVLLHDLWSGEREAGRLALLQSLPRSAWRVFGARAAARALLVLAALAVPFVIGALAVGTPPPDLVQAMGWITAMVVFWTAVALLVAARPWRAVTHACVLCGLWFLLTLVAPTAASLAINAAVPLPDGADLARENREAVHSAWDLPRQATLDRFVELYPEWRTDPMERPFEWKWYFAFQHLGDLHVAQTARAYRDGVAERERMAGFAAWAMPPIAIQRSLLRLAQTDVAAQLVFQDRVRAYHNQLRAFYYPYLFHERPFGRGDFAKAPRFSMVESYALQP
jgi:ABC-2 type transport system permease protein